MPLHRHTTTIDVGRSVLQLIRLPNPCFLDLRQLPTRNMTVNARVNRIVTIGMTYQAIEWPEIRIGDFAVVAQIADCQSLEMQRDPRAVTPSTEPLVAETTRDAFRIL